MKEGEQLMRLREVAARLRISVRTVWRMIAAGELPIVKLSKRVVRVEPAALQAWIEQRRSKRGF